jgi:hypothetical protein
LIQENVGQSKRFIDRRLIGGRDSVEQLQSGVQFRIPSSRLPYK